MVFDSILFGYNNRNILNGIYLKIPKNNIVGLFGLNGSGKSTLLKIGCGYLKADNGNIFINGISQYESSLVNRFSNLAYLSQNSFLPTDITIRKLIRDTGFDENKFMDDKLISVLFNNKIKTLSGGELRYLEVILLLELDREYYLLDEPFSGIEPLIIELIIKRILEAKERGKGILITDHFYRYVKEISDVSYILNEGRCYQLNNENITQELVRFGYVSKDFG